MSLDRAVWRHRIRVLEAAALLAVLLPLIRLVPLTRLIGLSGLTLNLEPPTRGDSTDPVAIAIGRAVAAAARRLPWHPLCLPQALAAGSMLSWRGYSCRICFGAQKSAGGLTAHAWLTLENAIVCGGQMDPALIPFRLTQPETSSR